MSQPGATPHQFLSDGPVAIVDGAKGGLFRLQFADKAMTKEQAAKLLGRLQGEKIVEFPAARRFRVKNWDALEALVD